VRRRCREIGLKGISRWDGLAFLSHFAHDRVL
jgi:hypothetical protein